MRRPTCVTKGFQSGSGPANSLAMRGPRFCSRPATLPQSSLCEGSCYPGHTCVAPIRFANRCLQSAEVSLTVTARSVMSCTPRMPTPMCPNVDLAVPPCLLHIPAFLVWPNPLRLVLIRAASVRFIGKHNPVPIRIVFWVLFGELLRECKSLRHLHWGKFLDHNLGEMTTAQSVRISDNRAVAHSDVVFMPQKSANTVGSSTSVFLVQRRWWRWWHVTPLDIVRGA
jgi:hypothetical protein